MFSRTIRHWTKRTQVRVRANFLAPDYSLKQMWQQGQLRTILSLFIILQLLDVLTSVIGGQVGLFEANPLTNLLLQQWGIIAFLWFKIPAVIVMALAMSKLNQKLATLIGIVGCLIMLFIVTSNLLLVINS